MKTQTTAAIPPAITSKVTITSGRSSGNAAGRLGAIERRLKRFQSTWSRLRSVEEVFGYVLFATVIVATIAAVLSLRGSRYDHVGRGGLFEDEPGRRPDPPPAVAAADRDDEIRQMLTARNARREARGQAAVDVEDELQRLTRSAPAAPDPALEAEVRQLVVARNDRRVRRGEAPLDVDEEVRRQLRDLMG